MKNPATCLESSTQSLPGTFLPGNGIRSRSLRGFNFRAIAVLLVLLAGLVASRAASGTWTNDATSVWSDATNWLNGTVANGTDAAADFSTIDITANRAVGLDSARSIGSLLFGDGAGAQSWSINSLNNVLTLSVSSGSPTVTVTNVAVLNVPLSGSAGLTKNGPGTLVLAGTNSYTGATIVNNGTLQITNSPGGVAGAGGLMNGSGGLVAYYSFNKVSGNRILNEGSGGALMDGAMVGSGGVSIGSGLGRFGDNCLNVTLGAVNNGANAANIGSGGYVLVNNPVVPFTCTSGSAAANWTWALWIKTTTAGAGYMYQGSGGWASGNTAFYLNNSAATGNSTTGTHAGGVRNSQGWEGGTATINDGNWHHVAMTCIAGTKVLYVDGAVDPFPVPANNNQWGGNGVGNQLWIGGTGGTLGDGNVPLVGLIDKVAIYNRALSLAEIQNLTNNIVPGLAAPSIPVNSPVLLASGTKVDLNGASATLTNVIGNGLLDTTVNGGYVAVNYGVDTAFNGIVTNSVGTLNYYKLGPGTLTISNALVNNNTVIRQGTVRVWGTIRTNGANNTITLADSTERAVLDIPAGTTVIARNLVVGGISASASGGGGAGAVYNRGVYVNFGNLGTGAFAIGNATGGSAPSNNVYGYFLHDSPVALAVGESGVGGLGGGDGVFELKSGTANFTNWITIGRCLGSVSGQQQRSLMLIRNGTVNGPNFGNEDRWNWSASTIAFYSVMDIGAGGMLGSLGVNHNINMGNDNNANAVSILTLDNGGIAQVNNINAGAVGPSCIVNLNNGTLLPNVATTTFIGANIDFLFLYSGGVTISNNVDLGIIPPMLAPGGSGITSIPVTGNGSGYIGRPIVQITDAGGGVGATAIAEWDQSSGTVTGITITAPGSSYSSPVVTLVGGGYTTAATLGTPVLGSVSSGGLTKLGTGTLTLSGGYSYTGPTLLLGGGLSTVSSLVTPGTPGSLTVSNAALSVDAASGIAMPVGNLILQSNTVLNLSYGTLSANPATPAINAGGSLSAPGSNIVINISAFGLKVGVFPLIQYTGTTPANLDNFSFGPLPPGVTATLVNNTGSHTIDINISTAGQNLTWYGFDFVNNVASSNWDITLTTNWFLTGTATSARYQEYTTTTTVGDPVTFNDAVYNDFVNPPPTNINLTTLLRPFKVTVDNGLVPYSFTGSGGLAGVQGGLVKSNTGSLTIGTSNSYTGGTFVYGGSLIISNDFALGHTNGSLLLGGVTLQVNGPLTNTRAVSVTANSTIGVIAPMTNRWGGLISGAGGLTKTDDGTLIVSGTNAITGNLVVHQGTLVSSASNNLPAIVTVGDTGSLNAVLKVTGGYFAANNNAGQFTSGLMVGSVAGAAGDVTVSAGTLSVNQQFGLGGAVGAYAGFNMTGGSLLSGSYVVVGLNGDSAVYNQSGGTCLVSNNLMTIAAGNAASIGVANFSGGTYTATNGVTGNNGTRGGIFVGENGTGFLNVFGTASLFAVGQANVTLGRTAGSAGTVTLNGGTITTPQVTRGGGPGWLNFGGGTLKATAATTTFITGLNAATVFGGGAIIDDGGFAVTIPQPLLAPNGFGVSSITLSSGGSGYIDSPIVTVSGGTGSNTVATAVVDPVAGTVTSIIVTCPGTGYTSGDVLSVAITGGGGIGAAANTPVLAATVSGGLTKRGTGTLTLTGVNTISGTLTVSGGTLSLNSASTYGGSANVAAGSLFTTTASQINGNVSVTNAAAFGVTQIGTASSTIANLTLGGPTASTNGGTLSLAFANGNTTTPLLTCNTLTLTGSNTISMAGRFTVGTVALIKYTGAIAGSGIINSNLAAPQGVVATLSNDVANTTLYAVISSTGPGLVWTGNNSNPALTNVWDKNSTTNWLIGAVPTTYQETVPPGDAVTFNDIGSGTVIASNSVRPFSVLISNNVVAYAFNGPGNIAGSAGITKLGSGTVTLNLTNNTYTGDTIVSNGAVVMGSASALSGSANLNVGPTALVELAGFSESVGSLFGSGVIDDNSSSSPTLTVGSGGSWSGTISNNPASSSGLFLTKNGSGTLVVSGKIYLNAGGGGQAGAQVNGGTMIITNNGLVSVGNSEFWIAQGATSATNIVDGGTMVISNNWLVIGRANAAANGTLIVNHGLVQKAGAFNIVVGSLGASGTIIVNGGQVLNNGQLWLGENATANGYLYLNGGLIQAAQVRPNGTPGPVNSIAYFNGGTLEATADSANFIGSTAMIQSGGLVLDDGGFTLNVGFLQVDGASPGGGLVKKGAGTVYLDAGNSYSGLTLVTNGMLAGVGTISGPVVVGPAGNIGAGDAGAIGSLLLASQPLTLQGAATFRISKTGGTPANDQIAGISTVNYGGTLVITNATSDSTPLTVGDTFPLFSASGFANNFTGISGSPGLGLAYSFDPSTGVLSIVSAPVQPIITGISISGGNLTITGTNGTTSQQFRVLATTNVAQPIVSWTPVYTNTFPGSGFSLTIPTGGGPQQFYLIVTP